MKTKFLIKYIVFLCVIYCNANTDKYRLIINSDPSSTITIAWNQISGTNPIVYYDTIDYGTDEGQYSFSKTADRTKDYRGMNSHFSRISGLAPNTNYYFFIKDSQSETQRYWFKTAPSDNSRLSFIVGGDSRNNRTPRINANKLVHKLKPHAVFFGGDMTAGGTDIEWQDWFDDWQLTIAPDGRMFPILAARGNHENSQMIYNFFDTPNINSYYAITFGDNLIRAYTLNSEISVLGDQLIWLQNDLSASNNMIWKMVQYHKPMRPHSSGKSEGNSQYDAWAQLFYDEDVKLVVDCDSHVSKTTWPIKPSSANGNDEGFIRDDINGTVYTGEGCWGAPLRPIDDTKSWTRNSGSFNQFKLVFVDENKMELRTILVTDNASSVDEVSNTDSFTLPANLEVFSPSTGEVVRIAKNTSSCPVADTTCDDGNANTTIDVEDGYCNCIGIPYSDIVNYQVSSGDDDAEQAESGGDVDISSSDLELVFDGHLNHNNQTVGIKFNEILIPKNAKILSAYIQFTVKQASSEATSVFIKGEKIANSLTFSDTDFNISNRATTDSIVNWMNIPAWSTIDDATADQKTPDLKEIVQEIVNLQDWKTLNSMSFIFTGQGKRLARSYNGSNSKAPKLTISYDLSSLPVITPVDYLDECEDLVDWNNGLVLNSADRKQGVASLEYTGSSTPEFYRSFSTPYDSGATVNNGVLNFWYYVSDVSKFNSSNQVELGSGGTSDINEYKWNLTGLVNGWNQIGLNMSDAATTNGAPNLNAINWFRIYHSKNGSVTTRVDGIYISNGSASAPIVPISYQAEDATFSGAKIASNQTGYNGTGFVDYKNSSADYIEWTVNVPSAGTYDLSFRYALPSGNRPLELKINGTTEIASMDFMGTGGWTQWDTVSTSQTLNSGNNTVRITVVGSSGGNLDELTVGPVGSAAKGSSKFRNISMADVSLASDTKFSIKNYPNPFNTATTLAYQLTESSIVTIDIYNFYGQKVASLATNEQQSAGGHSKVWDPTSLSNVSSGIYVCVIQIKNTNTSVVKSHKLNFVR